MQKPKSDKKTATKKPTKAPKAEVSIPVEVGEVKNLPAPFSARPIVFNISEAKIAEIRRDAEGLTINGVEDKKGYQVVRTARLNIRGLRAGLESSRKEQKADAIEYGRRLDAEAKTLTALLEEIEAPLLKMEEEIDKEIEAGKARAQKERDAKNQARYDALSAVGVVVDFNEAARIVLLSDEEFEARLARETDDYQLKQLQEEQEAAELDQFRREKEEREAAEAAALRVKREEEEAALAEQRRQQEARQAELDARERELNEKEQKRLREEALEKARKEGEEKAAREAQEKLERDRAAEQKAAALRPDKEKMEKYIDGLRAVPFPEMATEEGKAILVKFKAAMRAAVEATK